MEKHVTVEDLGASGGKIMSSHEALEMGKLAQSQEAQESAADEDRSAIKFSHIPDFSLNYHFWGIGGGNTLEITARGVDGNEIDEDAMYVQSLRVNGAPWDKAWVAWDDIFAEGGSMEFVLGPDPKDWATGPLPPSPVSGEFPHGKHAGA